MGTGEIVAIILLGLIIGGAVLYIVKAKKSGKKCIGCPDSGKCSGCCACGKRACEEATTDCQKEGDGE